MFSREGKPSGWGYLSITLSEITTDQRPRISYPVTLGEITEDLGCAAKQPLGIRAAHANAEEA